MKNGDPPSNLDITERVETTSMRRDPGATMPLEDLRLPELLTIQKQLGHLCRRQREKRWWKRMVDWEPLFGALSLLLWGALIAGALAAIPFFDSDPTHVAKREYVGLLVITAILAVVTTTARMAIKEKESVSILLVYDMVTDIIESYPSSSQKDAAS